MTEAKRVDFDKPQSSAEIRRAAGKKQTVRRQPIPVLPPVDVDPDKIPKKPDQRAAAAVVLRLHGTPFYEIAKQLEYADAAAAKNAYIGALTRMGPPEEWEVLRQMETMRAEDLFRRSLAMASADYLVVHRTAEDEEGNEIEIEEHIPNTEKLRWHEQAAKDLMAHAIISGAKAPARVEVTADTQEINQMVQVLLAKHQGELPVAVEADIWDVEEIPDDVEPRED